MQTLVGGDIDVIYVTGAAAVTVAGRGAPVVIIATSGHNDYKMLAHSSIASLSQLKGKTIGISNPAGSDYFALRRMLPKLGLVPGKDVSFLTTGIQSSIEKVLLVLEGRIHATLGSSDTVALYELKGQKLSVLADAVENGVYVTSGDIATKRQFLKDGGLGFPWENDLQLYVRRAKVGEPLLGGTAEHRALAARQVLAAHRTEGN